MTTLSQENPPDVPPDVWTLAGKALGSPTMNRDLIRRRVANAIMADRIASRALLGKAAEEIKTLLGAFDTPIARRQIDSDFANEVRISARATLSLIQSEAAK